MRGEQCQALPAVCKNVTFILRQHKNIFSNISFKQKIGAEHIAKILEQKNSIGYINNNLYKFLK